MEKEFVKYLLIVSMLLNGLSPLFADAFTSSTLYQSVKSLKNTESSVAMLTPVNYDILHPLVSFGVENKTYRLNTPFIENEKEEDEELHASRKHVRNSSNATCFFLSQTPQFFACRSKKTLLLHTYLPHAAQYQYLIYQVFRV